MSLPADGLLRGNDGLLRCAWQQNLPDYAHYHDHEWGRPVRDDVRLFEKLCLEGFQAGLSWLTILRKREHFRAAFAGFDRPGFVQQGAGVAFGLHPARPERRLDRRIPRPRRRVTGARPVDGP